MTSVKKMFLIGFALLSLSLASFGQVGISVNFAPPALPVYDQPVCPGDGYIWTPGYWAWDGDDYYWVPGTWVLAPEVGFLWTPPWWGWEGGAFLFHEGWWGPQVGFYGGINYGFGYFGTGFVGGRWDGGHFFYNRAVMNVNVVNIHNVYNETVVNRTVNHVSYNGGQGGIEARANAREEAAFHEHHVGPVAAQTHHMDEARGNKELRANVNHGRPPVAATARPADFKHDAMPAREAGGAYNENRGNGSRGNASEPKSFGHVKDVPPLEHPAAPNTGNAKLDQKYQKQQDKLFSQQQKERQKVQQQQEREDQKVAKQANNAPRRQQVEQRHQQQTQQMVQRHANQSHALQSRQAAPRGGPPHR
ncbi:MAG TPA: hypothetical protein VHW45_03710 [Candidatus Sulfotelmatobacter sp.]|jgi:hypothetical protein|nr:hypothetical protein [Candidatus Sulfotelmatobacter sp.]